MIPSSEFISRAFDQFNELIFGSSLPPIPVKFTRARSYLGKVQYRKKFSFRTFKRTNDNFLMRISTMYDLSQSEWEDIVIHEMIHYYIALNNLKDTSVHGRRFREYMKRINSNYGRNITISHRIGQG